jgi:hypothetical protein
MIGHHCVAAIMPHLRKQKAFYAQNTSETLDWLGN